MRIFNIFKSILTGQSGAWLVKILLWIGLVTLALNTFATTATTTDSTGIHSVTPTITNNSPQKWNSGVFNYGTSVSPWIGINYSGGGVQLCSNPSSGAGTSTNPCQLHMVSGSTSVSSDYITVPYSGYVYVTAAVTLVQQQSSPVYYWMDGWTYGQDVNGNNQSIRIFYTGDVPSQLNPGNGNPAVVNLYGGTYVTAGTQLYAPRIWVSGGGQLEIFSMAWNATMMTAP
jgi:hypothetical protein